jgi:outer membrane protein OmpA-like peptidoglycan-associated protein
MPRLAIALAALAIPSTVAAQAMSIDEFRPAIDSRGFLTLNGSQTLGHGEMSFGLGSLQWGHKLLSLSNGPATYSVDNMVSATLVGALGLRLGRVPLEVGVALPFTIMNGSRGPDALGDPSNPNDDKLYRLAGQGLGDLALHGKVRLGRLGRVGVAAIASVYIPTGDARDPFLGEAATTPQLIGVADAGFGKLRLAVNGGVRLRRTTTTTIMEMGDTMGSITSSTALPVGLGAAYGLVPDKVELVAEVFGAIAVGAHHGYQPLEALGGVKVYLAKNSYLSIGAGRGLMPSQAGNPDFRGLIGIVFEPRPAQRVAGSIPDDDVVRAPPVQKQDDGTGDRDNDGIADRDDACPDDPEVYNGIEDTDGCPDVDRPLVIVSEAEMVPLEPIEFELDKDVLRPSAFPILAAVVKSLRDNPEIALVEVQGHTDEQGGDAYNMDLSRRRAATVMRYLVDAGIDAARLTSKGYGETEPVDHRHTQEAYTANRRVAFIIKRRD